MKPIHVVLAAAAALPLVLLPACSSSTVDAPGTASIAMTDAGLDDLDLFEVDVSGIVFTKASGATVSVLSRRARVDFVSLEDLGDLVARVSLEAGFYTGMTLTLDFAQAEVYLKNKTTPATVLGLGGSPLTTTVDIPITFAVGNRPFVLPNRHHLFMLDLDLAQAVTVDDPANEVTFVPAVSAEVDPTNAKPVALSGILMSIDTAANTFVVEKRDTTGAAIADFTIQALTTTVFQIDGVNYLGAGAGLPVMQGLTLGQSRVYVQGIIDPAAAVLYPVAVESGVGMPGNGQDWVLGWVTARTGGAGSSATLTVMGRSFDDPSGTRTFNTAHTVDVTLGTTRVLRRGVWTSLSTDALNVGQLVMAFGTLSGTVLDATGNDGVVRMALTSAFGTAAGPASSNTLTLNLDRFGLRPVGIMNFTVAATPEANPGAYTVDVTGLDTTGVVAGSKIRAIGWTNPVGIPTDANFQALSLVNRSTEGKLMITGWVPSVTASSVIQVDTSALVFDVSAAQAGFVYDGFASVNMTASPTPSIVPLFALGIYRIVQNGGVELHLGFPSFATSLGARIAGSTTVARISALGTYDDVTQVFSGGVVTVVLQ